jgi:hypothetical protein
MPCWMLGPSGCIGKALLSFVSSGDVVAVRPTPRIVGLAIVSAQMLPHLDAGRLHVQHVLPLPGGRVHRYQGTSTRLDRCEDSRF